MEQQKRTYLYNHTSQETAYVVNDYPWGFRLRTQIRYWIESKPKHGQRFGSQTINPKTGKWCAPKYSTYSPIMIMFLDEKEHVHFTCLRMHDSEEHVTSFKEKHLDNLTDFQKESLKEIIGCNNVMKHVTFEFKARPAFSLLSTDPEEIAKREQFLKEREEHDKEQDLIKRKINSAINYEIKKVVL